MSQDLFFGKTNRNWGREPAASNPEFAVKVEAARQASKLDQLKVLKAKADAGDKKAQKKWAKISKKVVKLHLKASKGDVKAAKSLAALTPTGLFVTTIGPKAMKTTMKGSFVGKDEILGAFVGDDTLTEIVGDDKLTEIVTSGSFIENDEITKAITSGDDKLTEIITSGNADLMGVYKKFPKVAQNAAFVGGYKRFPKVAQNAAFVGQFIGEEELALAVEGGACERAALKRRSRRTA